MNVLEFFVLLFLHQDVKVVIEDKMNDERNKNLFNKKKFFLENNGYFKLPNIRIWIM